MKWKDKLLNQIAKDLFPNELWNTRDIKIRANFDKIAIHLAVFSEPILDTLLTGEKTFESRFSNNNISPHGKIKSGDIVLVKKSGGPIVAAFTSGIVFSYSNLNPSRVSTLKNEFCQRLGLKKEDKFWNQKKNSKYATLISVKNLKALEPYRIEKKDRTGWVIIKQRKAEDIFA